MSFNKVLEVHDHLAELFRKHQEALVGLNFEEAVERLAVYRRELAAHIDVEEVLLMPIYKRAGVIAGGPPEFFIGEHERMMRFLDRFEIVLDKLRFEQADLIRKTIDLLDQEAAYKSLLEHHESRERNLFFPALERVTSDEERDELVEMCMRANQIMVSDKQKRLTDHRRDGEWRTLAAASSSIGGRA